MAEFKTTLDLSYRFHLLFAFAGHSNVCYTQWARQVDSICTTFVVYTNTYSVFHCFMCSVSVYRMFQTTRQKYPKVACRENPAMSEFSSGRCSQHQFIFLALARSAVTSPFVLIRITCPRSFSFSRIKLMYLCPCFSREVFTTILKVHVLK